jgi:hypothetical protein
LDKDDGRKGKEEFKVEERVLGMVRRLVEVQMMMQGVEVKEDSKVDRLARDIIQEYCKRNPDKVATMAGVDKQFKEFIESYDL